MSERVKLHKVYFEIRVYGQYLRVHAIDPDTGIEAIATGQKKIGEAALKRNAQHKLEYILTRRKKQAQEKERDTWA